MARAGMPAARRRSASRSVSRSPAMAATRSASGEGPRRRLEHGGLARPRRAHQVDRQHAVRREVLAVVGGLARSLTERMRSWTSTGTRCGIAAAARLAHQGTSSSIWPSRISSPPPARAGAPHAGHCSTLAGVDRAAAPGALPARRDAFDLQRRARADRAVAHDVEGALEQLGSDAGQLADAARGRDGRRWRAARRLPASMRSISASTSEYSCIGSLRLPPGGGETNTGGRFSKNAARPSAKSGVFAMRARCIEFLIEMEVEPVDARRLVHATAS